MKFLRKLSDAWIRKHIMSDPYEQYSRLDLENGLGR